MYIAQSKSRSGKSLGAQSVQMYSKLASHCVIVFTHIDVFPSVGLPSLVALVVFVIEGSGLLPQSVRSMARYIAAIIIMKWKIQYFSRSASSRRFCTAILFGFFIVQLLHSLLFSYRPC